MSSGATSVASDGASVDWGRLVTTSLPVMMGYVPLSMAFGYLLQLSGGSWWHAPLMSLLVFAGAAQFSAISMLGAGLSVFEIAIATLLINLRHIFYGLSLLGDLPKDRLRRGYMIFTLTDENYSLLTTIERGTPERFRFYLTVLNHSYWIGGTIIGALVGRAVPQKIEGIEFSLTALFVVLTIEQAYKVKQWLPFGVAAVSYGVAMLVRPDQALLVSVCLAFLTAWARASWRVRSASRSERDTRSEVLP